jgi:glycosidase
VGRTNTLGPEAANHGNNKAIFREAVVMQMTWVGAPTIYYGDEAGLCGFTDPDNRRTYPWGKEDKELIQFHKDIIRIHKENQSLRDGSIKYIDADYNYLAYGRFKKEECCVVENAPLGVRAAKSAGLFTIAVNTGILENERLSQEKADLVLPNMHALLQWLQEHMKE